MLPDIIAPDSARTLDGLFAERVHRTPDARAYLCYDPVTAIWLPLTWRMADLEVNRWRAALQAEGFTPGDRMAVMLPNSVEWIWFDQAALSLGLVVVPLYPNDRPENIAYILENSGARLLLCPGLAYRKSLEGILAGIDTLQRIVTIDHCLSRPDHPQVRCVTDWLPSDALPAPATGKSDPHALATVVYTSGTTGKPKGVMLSHANILSNAHAGISAIDVSPTDLFLSFLPLSHMLERTAGYYIPMMAGACVAFSRGVPQLAEDLVTVKPTMLIAVPRIFERVHAKISTALPQGPKLKKLLFRLAEKIGWQHFLFRQGRGPWSPALLLWPFFDLLVAKKVRDRLGGRLRVVISGGAPLSLAIARTFLGLGLPICQGYGLTETSPVISVNRPEDNRPQGVGPPLPGVRVAISDSGELLVQGPLVMLGYWRNTGATAQVIDHDGWLHTGDKAILKEGHLTLTGRIKEIIVLSTGEKIAPARLETALMSDPLFEQALIVGEGHPHLALVTVLNEDEWDRLAKKLAVPPDEASLSLPLVKKAVLEKAEKLLHGFPGYAKIFQVACTLEPWTTEAGLLTPTLKLKRDRIIEHMGTMVAALFDDTHPHDDHGRTTPLS